MKLRALALLFLLVSGLRAASPHREPTTFSYTGDVGFGKSVFVAGSHLDVGSWDLTKAIKLRYTAGNVWTNCSIALPRAKPRPTAGAIPPTAAIWALA